jgi:hypothetical protein
MSTAFEGRKSECLERECFVCDTLGFWCPISGKTTRGCTAERELNAGLFDVYGSEERVGHT